MSDVLTIAVGLACPHSFPIVVTANATLTIGGVSVFGPTDLSGAKVSCTAAQSKCASVASPGPGATALVVDGTGVMLASFAALTDKGKISIGPAPAPPSAATAV